MADDPDRRYLRFTAGPCVVTGCALLVIGVLAALANQFAYAVGGLALIVWGRRRAASARR